VGQPTAAAFGFRTVRVKGAHTEVAQTRIAVVGVGDFGEQHVRYFQALPDVTVAAVVDLDGDRADEIAARYGVSRWFTDFADLFDQIDLDGVSIVTPAQTHGALVTEAAKRGIPILLEKPVLSKFADAQPLIAAAQQVPILPAHILRFCTPYRALKLRVDSGELGRIVAISARRHRGHDHIQRFASTHLAHMTTIHDIDLALWITGARPLKAMVHTRHATGAANPDYLSASVEADDDSLWDFQTSWLLSENARSSDRLEVFGTRGSAYVDTAEGFDFEETMIAELAEFVQSIGSGEASRVVTVDEALIGIALADAIAVAGATGDVVPVFSE